MIPLNNKLYHSRRNFAKYWSKHNAETLVSPLSHDVPIWGSYRPNIYFGMKTRTVPLSLVTGILWGSNNDINVNRNLRHDTSQDELEKFHWLRHNGKSYGIEEMIDNKYNVKLTGTFLLPYIFNKDVDSIYPTWVQRIAVDNIRSIDKSKSSKSLFFYLGIECNDDDGDSNGVRDLQSIHIENISNGSLKIYGTSKTLGHFCIVVNLLDETATSNKASLSYVTVADIDSSSGVEKIKEHFSNTPNESGTSLFDISGDLSNSVVNGASFIAIQARSNDEMRLEISYYENNNYFDSKLSIQEAKVKWGEITIESMKSSHTALIDNWIEFSDNDFNNKFTEKYKLGEKLNIRNDVLFSPLDIEAGKIALSSTLGGIGFFYGKPDMADGMDITETGETIMNEKPPSKSKKATKVDYVSLFTATPSRTAFPRGFLWDEGFHQLLISQWDLSITMQVLSGWLNAMYLFRPDGENTPAIEEYGGWIPREMILGNTARKRVPDEFIKQRVNIANPPTILLVFESLLDKYLASKTCSDEKSQNETVAILKFITESYPYLQQWIRWFLNSQKGPDPAHNSFRWRGRSHSDKKLVPNTLSSGLDDYPRSQLPTSNEYHVDLHCWIVKSTTILSKIQSILKKSPEHVDYGVMSNTLLSSLDGLHWSEGYQAYLDVGLDSNKSAIVTEIIFRCYNPTDRRLAEIAVPIEYASTGENYCPASFPNLMGPSRDEYGHVKTRERVHTEKLLLQHVPRIGYVTIFPFILKLIPTDSPKLSAILDIIGSKDLLWSDHGLRSMATTDMFYLKSNAPGDNPYWRGPIWININYLALGSLHHYASLDGPYQQRSVNLYNALRENILRTVLSSFHKTGHFWEQYNDESGEGIRGHPFTGWTALILNIMSEKY